MYSFQSRVRYSEVNRKKQLDLTSIINYFQDCSTFQSEDIGKGLDYLEQNHHIWLMNSWQLEINHLPDMGEQISICTWPYGFKGMYGYRNFLIKDSMDNILVAANSIWVLLDTNTNRPVKVSEEDMSGYCLEEKYDMEYKKRKVDIPDNLITYKEFTVINGNIDTNNHVNNGQYIKMAEEYIPSNFNVSKLRAEYRLPALLGDTIIPKVSIQDSLCTIVLTGISGNPYAIIEFEN